MTTEEARHELYEAARRELGDGPAAALMVQLFAMDPERVAIKDDLAGVRGELAELRGEIAEMRGEITAVRGEITELRGEITSVRGDVQFDNARQTRQLTLTILVAFVAQFAGTVSVLLSLA